MSKLLFLCRHAEAEDPLNSLPDRDRCLTSTGIIQARQTATWLQYRYQAESIISSPAERTCQTARLLAATMNLNSAEIIFKPELYNAPVGIITNIVLQLPDTVNNIILVGHNPGITKAVEALAGRETGYMNPAGLAIISFEIESWEQTATTPGTLIEFFQPG